VTGGQVVGPLPRILYVDGSSEVYTPPVNTLDLRYVACTEHHRACDCREALHAEDRQELRAYADEVEKFEGWAHAVALLHQRKPNQYVGNYCAACNVPWPCATWKLTAAADWLVGVVDKQFEGIFQ
jgi:hypothetical protein